MDWITAKEFEDITYKKCNGVAKLLSMAGCAQCVSSKTTAELYNAFYDAGRYVVVVLLPKDLHLKMAYILL
jgi:1,4-dihydroxy-2-naphthoyl-CoA synthase